jgi:hypothetical protein
MSQGSNRGGGRRCGHCELVGHQRREASRCPPAVEARRPDNPSPPESSRVLQSPAEEPGEPYRPLKASATGWFSVASISGGGAIRRVRYTSTKAGQFFLFAFSGQRIATSRWNGTFVSMGWSNGCRKMTVRFPSRRIEFKTSRCGRRLLSGGTCFRCSQAAVSRLKSTVNAGRPLAFRTNPLIP